MEIVIGALGLFAGAWYASWLGCKRSAGWDESEV